MTAAVLTVTMLMVVMVAANIGIISQPVCQEGLDRLVRIAPDAAVKPDTGIGKGHLSAAADAAADQDLHAVSGQKACQCPMSTAFGGQHPGAYDGIALDLIELKICRMAKVLKNIFAVIGYRNFHKFFLSMVLIKNERARDGSQLMLLSILLPLGFGNT